MAERFKALNSKLRMGLKPHRGFESRPVRQILLSEDCKCISRQNRMARHFMAILKGISTLRSSVRSAMRGSNQSFSGNLDTARDSLAKVYFQLGWWLL